MQRVILVGRHTPVGMGQEIEVVAQENILWSLNAQECAKQWQNLVHQAQGKNAAILLQNIPGILGIVMLRLVDYGMVKIGVIISVPGERKANAKKRFGFGDGYDAVEARDAIKYANARAQVEFVGNDIEVTVDPVPEFVFSHIEWV